MDIDSGTLGGAGEARTFAGRSETSRRSFRPVGAPASPRIVSTLHWPLRRRWTSEVTVVDRRSAGTAAALRRLAATAGDYDAVVLDGATGGAVRLVDLGAAALLALRSAGPAVVITDATWSHGRRALDRATRRAGLAAIDGPRVTYCVLTSEERVAFSRAWGVPPERVAYTPFYYTASDEDLAAPTSDDGGIFAGGDSLRDYGPLVSALEKLRAPVTLATSLVSREARARLPANVRCGRVPHEEFMALMRAATVVVVPLADRRDRGAGQQTYLNAMAFGKLVVVSDAMGVRDYVEHGRTGLVVPPGDAAALARTLRWALDPANREACRDIAGRARETVRAKFSPERYVDAVLDVVHRSVARLRRGA